MTQEKNLSEGRFIAFEGIDGSGKTTQAARLAARLKKMGLPCCRTKEPTDGPVGSLVHQIMTGRISADARVVASLYAADRLDHLLNGTDGILSLIRAGTHVITDRYYFSSYAYHSVDMDLDWVIQANAQAARLLRPTATLFIDVDPDTALERISQNRLHTEIYENRARLTRVRECYLRAFEREREHETVLTLDGRKSEDELDADIWEAVRGFF